MAEAPAAQPSGTWPPPFATTFVSRARQMLDESPGLVIVGPPWSGCNRLAAEIADLSSGPTWNRHLGRYGEHKVPYFAIRQMLRSLRPPADASIDDVLQSAHRELTEHRQDVPVLVLGNAHLADPQSIEVLTQLVRQGSAKVIATCTPEGVQSGIDLSGFIARLDLPPLDAETISLVLAARFGCAVHPTVADLIHQRTRGAYRVVQEVADASWNTGMLVEIEGVLAINPHPSAATTANLTQILSRSSADRLSTDPRAADLLHVAALVGELNLAEARSVFDTESLEKAIAVSALRVERDALVPASRAEAMLLTRTMSPARQRALYEAYAHRIPASLARQGVAAAVAQWCRATGRLLPVELAARAAREANLSGQFRRAAVFTDPASNVDHALVAPIERIFALVELGEQFDLDATFAAIVPEQLDEDGLLVYVRWASRLRSVSERERLIARAIESEDPAIARRRRSVATLAELIEQAYSNGGDELVSRVRALAFSDQLSDGNRAVAYAAMAATLRHSGDPGRAVEAAEAALDILARHPSTLSAFHLDIAQEMHILCLISAVELDKAEEAVSNYSSGVFSYAGRGRLTTALRAFIALFRGDVQQALANARLCLIGLENHDPHHIRGWVEAMLAQILVQAERPEEALDFLALAESRRSRRRQPDLERRLTIACVYDSLGEPEVALEILESVRAEAREYSLRLTEIDAAVLSTQIGGPSHLPTLLEAVDHLDDPSGTPEIWQTFAHAVRDWDFVALEKLAGRLDESGARLFAAEVAQYTLDIARRATDLSPSAREHLARIADPMSHRMPTR